MFARIKESGRYQYLQIVENRREGPKVRQRVIATLGRMDRLASKGEVETLIRSLARYSERVLLVLSDKRDVCAHSKKMGPALIFQRLWEQLGIKRILGELLADRKFSFDVERAIFLTVLHRLFASGSDRSCDAWRRDYAIAGVEELSLHHLYRAMAFLGEKIQDQKDATPFAPRCIKDVVEEGMFFERRDLFTGLDLVFFDTTSIYFEGAGGLTLGQRGFSKDHRSDLNQMVVGVVLDSFGKPVCCEMWPGNTTDVTTLIPVVDRTRNRFRLGSFCIVADRGMISDDTMQALEAPERNLTYILGTRMRRVNEVKREVLSRAGRYKEVYPSGKVSKDPAPLKVKEVWVVEATFIGLPRPGGPSLHRLFQCQAGPKRRSGSQGYGGSAQRATQERPQELDREQGVSEVSQGHREKCHARSGPDRGGSEIRWEMGVENQYAAFSRTGSAQIQRTLADRTNLQRSESYSGNQTGVSSTG